MMQLSIYVGAAAILAIVAIVGLALIRAGRRYLRTAIDAAPYCGGCGYNLSGLVGVSKRCPECGAELGAGAVVKGDPKGRTRAVRRNRLGLVIASIGFVGALTTGYRGYRLIDWYQFRSFDNLMSDLDARDRRAWPELRRRMTSGKLTSPQQDVVVQFALDQRGGVSRQMWTPMWTPMWVQVFWECDNLGWIAPDVKQQLIRSALKIIHSFPERIRQGYDAVGRLEVQDDMVFRALGLGGLRILQVEFRIDDGAWMQLTPGTAATNDDYIQPLPTRGLGIGTYRFDLRLKARAYPYSWQPYGAPAAPSHIILDDALAGAFEIVAFDTSAELISGKDESNPGRFLFVHQLDFLKEDVSIRRAVRTLRYEFSVATPPPVPLALEVELVLGDQAYPGDPIVIADSTLSNGRKLFGSIRAPAHAGDRVKLRLRASAQVARQTADVFKYWDVAWEEGPFILRDR